MAESYKDLVCKYDTSFTVLKTIELFTDGTMKNYTMFIHRIASFLSTMYETFIVYMGLMNCFRIYGIISTD